MSSANDTKYYNVTPLSDSYPGLQPSTPTTVDTVSEHSDFMLCGATTLAKHVVKVRHVVWMNKIQDVWRIRKILGSKILCGSNLGGGCRNPSGGRVTCDGGDDWMGLNVGNLVGQNAVQNEGIQNVGNQNGLSVISGIANQYRNGNVEIAPADRKGNGINATAADCSRGRIRDPNHSRRIKFVAAADAYEKTKRVKVNYTSDDTLQQAFTSEEQYTELLEPIPEPRQVQQNDSNVIYAVFSMEQGGGTVEQYSATVEETRTYHELIFHNLAAEVEKVNSVNRKIKETNAELTTKLARYKNQYMNVMKSRKKNQSANVSKSANQKKCKANVKKSKKSGSKESLASPSKPRSFLSWKVYSVICLTNNSNGENQVVSKSFAVTTADASDKRQ
nr:hypothetical protein [Tanacetum cinerariifolium]